MPGTRHIYGGGGDGGRREGAHRGLGGALTCAVPLWFCGSRVQRGPAKGCVVSRHALTPAAIGAIAADGGADAATGAHS